MDFRLTALSDAFKSVEYRTSQEDFALFAFILATTADEAIFPRLLVHFPELHELTSHYILVVSPNVLMNKEQNKPMSASEVATVLKSGIFRNYQRSDGVDVSEAVEGFLERQTTEAIKFARFCGLGVDSLPSILFFTSLTEPDSYVHWSLKEQDAASVIRDFRAIVGRIEDKCSELVDLVAEIKQLKEHRTRMTRDICVRESSLKKRIKRLEAAAGIYDEYTAVKVEYQSTPELNREIEAAKDDLVKAFWELIEKRQYHFPMDRISRKLQEASIRPNDKAVESFIRTFVVDVPILREKFERYLQVVHKKKEVVIKKKQQTNRASDTLLLKRELDCLNEPLNKVDLELANLISRKESWSLYLLDVVTSLNRKRFVRKTLADLSKSVPLFNLGLSAAKIFEG